VILVRAFLGNVVLCQCRKNRRFRDQKSNGICKNISASNSLDLHINAVFLASLLNLF